MKLRIVATLSNVNDKNRKALVRVTQEADNPLALHFLAEFYEAVIRSMRDYNEDAFDEALGKFIDDDYDKVIAKFERELNNED